jgi:uncharacterized repeat protein (TIGR01451 family)
MKPFDSSLKCATSRRRSPVLRALIVVPVALALALSTGAVVAAALPATSAQACEPEVTSPPDTSPNIARPRASTAGKDLNGGQLVPGDEIRWTVTVKNVGDELTNVVITDVVPKWTTYVAGSIEGSGADDSGSPTLSWSIGALGCGDRVTVSFRSRVDDGVAAGTLISNQASADSSQTPAGTSGAATLEVGGSSVESPGESSGSSTSTTLTTDKTEVQKGLGLFGRLCSDL